MSMATEFIHECMPRQHATAASYSPYVDNGGTIVAIAGSDCTVCVADTRLSTGFRIHTRQTCKWTKLTDKIMIASVGMQADIAMLHKLLQHRVAQYTYRHNREPPIGAVAQLLSTLLYYKRFFPYYAFNALVGLTSEGEGVIYSYDAIGSFECLKYTAQGSGSVMAIPLLDSQCYERDVTRSQAIDIAKEALVSVAERDIYTGDFADFVCIDQTGFKIAQISLKKD